MFFKPFELRGHRQCPHKTPSNCNTSVIPMLLNKFCPRKPQKPVHTHTHTHTYTHTHLFHYPCGDFHRRNGFSTVQTVYSIALHQPYT